MGPFSYEGIDYFERYCNDCAKCPLCFTHLLWTRKCKCRGNPNPMGILGFARDRTEGDEPGEPVNVKEPATANEPILDNHNEGIENVEKGEKGEKLDDQDHKESESLSNLSDDVKASEIAASQGAPKAKVAAAKAKGRASKIAASQGAPKAKVAAAKAKGPAVTASKKRQRVADAEEDEVIDVHSAFQPSPVANPKNKKSQNNSQKPLAKKQKTSKE
jgi:hypothetical protein